LVILPESTQSTQAALQGHAELGQVWVVIQFGPVSEAAGPSINTSDGVGGGLLALLVLSVVPGYSAVSGLGLDSLTVGANQNGGHETQGAVALSNGVGLHVTVVVLAGPYEFTRGFEALGDHVVDQPVLIPDASGIEILFVLFLVDVFKDILEAAVIPLQDGVLGGHVERPFLLQGLDKTGMSEVCDTLISVIHSHDNTASTLETKDGVLLGVATIGIRNHHGDLLRTLNDKVASFVLISMSVTANADRLIPSGNEAGNGLAKNGFTENGTSKDVPDGAIR